MQVLEALRPPSRTPLPPKGLFQFHWEGGGTTEKLQSSGVIGFLKWPIDQHERGMGKVRQEVGEPGSSSVGHLGGGWLSIRREGKDGEVVKKPLAGCTQSPGGCWGEKCCQSLLLVFEIKV